MTAAVAWDYLRHEEPRRTQLDDLLAAAVARAPHVLWAVYTRAGRWSVLCDVCSARSAGRELLSAALDDLPVRCPGPARSEQGC